MTDEQIEAERSAICKAVYDEIRRDPQAVVSHEAIGAAIEAKFPGYGYDAVADSWERFRDPDEQEVVHAPLEDAGRLHALGHQLDMKIGDLRSETYTATEAARQARGLLADSILAMQTKSPRCRVTAEQNVRSFLAASVAGREADKRNGASRIPDGARGRSQIDRSAAYGHGGNANDFVRKQMRTGFRRRPPSER